MSTIYLESEYRKITLIKKATELIKKLVLILLMAGTFVAGLVILVWLLPF